MKAKNRIGTALTVGLISVALLGTSGCASATPQASAPSPYRDSIVPEAAPVDSAVATQVESEESAFTTAESAATSMFPELFTGLAYDDNETAITVYATRADKSFEAFMTSKLASVGLPVRFVVAANSASAMSAANEHLMSLSSALVEEGIQLVAFGPSIRTGLVEADVIDMTPDQQARLAEEFGPVVAFRSIAEESAPLQADLRNDSAP